MNSRSTGKRRSPAPPIAIPVDLERALAADPLARAAFDRLPPSHRREYIEWIEEAKREATRHSRVRKTLAMLLEKG